MKVKHIQRENRFNEAWIIVVMFICLSVRIAAADISNELVVGLRGDQTVSATVDGSSASDNSTKQASYSARYTYFFSPLREDETPIELRKFYQHPSNLSVGLTHAATRDQREVYGVSPPPNRKERTRIVTDRLDLGGEQFLDATTGLSMDVTAVSGNATSAVGGVVQPDTNLKSRSLDFGLKHYLLPECELHLRYHVARSETAQNGQPKETSDRSVVYLGIGAVSNNKVGLDVEIGKGAHEDTTEGVNSTDEYNVTAFNIRLTGYIGTHLSVRLGIEYEKMNASAGNEGLPSSTTRTSLAGKLWFTENFGLELPIYMITYDQTIYPTPMIGRLDTRMRNIGVGLYAAYRF